MEKGPPGQNAGAVHTHSRQLTAAHHRQGQGAAGEGAPLTPLTCRAPSVAARSQPLPVRVVLALFAVVAPTVHARRLAGPCRACIPTCSPASPWPTFSRCACVCCIAATPHPSHDLSRVAGAGLAHQSSVTTAVHEHPPPAGLDAAQCFLDAMRHSAHGAGFGPTRSRLPGLNLARPEPWCCAPPPPGLGAHAPLPPITPLPSCATPTFRSHGTPCWTRWTKCGRMHACMCAPAACAGMRAASSLPARCCSIQSLQTRCLAEGGGVRCRKAGV